MHGATEEAKKIRKLRVVDKLVRMYGDQDRIQVGFEYMFKENIEILCRRLTQYLIKWLSSCWLAMEKISEIDDGTDKRKRHRKPNKRERETGTGAEVRGADKGVAPYSMSHQRWLENITHTRNELQGTEVDD